MEPVYLVVFTLALALTVTGLLLIQSQRQTQGLRRLLNQLIHSKHSDPKEEDEHTTN